MKQITFDEYLRYAYERIELCGSIQADKIRIENLRKVLKILGPDIKPESAQILGPDIKPESAQITEKTCPDETVIDFYEQQMAELKPAKRSKRGKKLCQ
jgi:hypothetical protein